MIVIPSIVRLFFVQLTLVQVIYCLVYIVLSGFVQ